MLDEGNLAVPSVAAEMVSLTVASALLIAIIIAVRAIVGALI